MLRGEIWLYNSSPSIGDEIRKIRPAVIVNNNEVGTLRLKVVVPITRVSASQALQIVGKRLLVVADGVLQYIPFAAIPLPTSSYAPLIKNHEIVNAPSAATIALQRQQPRRSAFKTLAVIADPVFVLV